MGVHPARSWGPPVAQDGALVVLVALGVCGGGGHLDCCGEPSAGLVRPTTGAGQCDGRQGRGRAQAAGPPSGRRGPSLHEQSGKRLGAPPCNADCWWDLRDIGRAGLVQPASRVEAQAAIDTLLCSGPYGARLPASCGGGR